MDSIYSMIGFFVTGGPFMYPILIVFAVGAAIATERYITLSLVTARNQSVWKEVQPALIEGDFERARELTSDDDSSISKLLSMGLDRQGAVRRREDIEIAMEESMMEIIPQLEKRTPYVALASNIATLLGLLGTIMGLIEAFTAVANGEPRGESRSTLGQHLGRDEHDGFRSDRRHSASRDQSGLDGQDERNCRQPRDGLSKGIECHFV